MGSLRLCKIVENLKQNRNPQAEAQPKLPQLMVVSVEVGICCEPRESAPGLVPSRNSPAGSRRSPCEEEAYCHVLYHSEKLETSGHP